MSILQLVTEQTLLSDLSAVSDQVVTITNHVLQTVNFVDVTGNYLVDVDVQAHQASSFTWQKTSGNAYWYTQNSGQRLYFDLLSYNSISFNVSTNSSSCGSISRNVTFVKSSGFFSMYPNPSSNELNITALEETVELYSGEQLIEEKLKPYFTKIVLVNEMGNEIKRFEFKEKTKSLKVDVSSLKSGIYAVQVYGGEEKFKVKDMLVVKKIVIE